jgi:IPT/TIG domain
LLFLTLVSGEMKAGCGESDFIDDQQREDKLNRIIKGMYYGHPNMKRAVFHNDPRQCVWRNPSEPTSVNYQSPLGIELSSATGIIEYKADHFNRQLRGNLIHVKYKSSLLRTVLSADGLSAHPLSVPATELTGSSGLDVTQAPNGNLIEVRYTRNMISVNVPTEAATSELKVNSVFPTRGSQAGGTLLRIYGTNFGSAAISVTVGTSKCPVVGIPSTTYIECTLPGGTGLVNVEVSSVSSSYTFQKGYRYITGF